MTPSEYASAFNLDDTIWLNCAHQGPLPKCAQNAVQRAIAMKANPALLADGLFFAVPKTLKENVARLIGAEPDDIVLGNSASYFVDLLARSLPFEKGDEILVAANDFPASVIGWKVLQQKGVILKTIKPANKSLTVGDLEKSATKNSKLLCVSWVNSFNGFGIDISEIGRFCRKHDIISCINASQALGYRPIDIKRAPIDVLFSCGFKWLLGPYGTGVGWIHPNIKKEMRQVRAYWLDFADSDLSSYRSINEKGLGQHTFLDVFGTANFLNFMALSESVRWLNGVGATNIFRHNLALVSQILRNLDAAKYRIVSPTKKKELNAIVVIEPLRSTGKKIVKKLEPANIFVANREGNIRISPHIYNCNADIQSLVSALNSS